MRPFLGQNDARRQSFTCKNIHPFRPLRHIALVSALRSFANLTSQIVRLEERKIVGRLGLSHCSQPSRIMLQHVVVCSLVYVAVSGAIYIERGRTISP